MGGGWAGYRESCVYANILTEGLRGALTGIAGCDSGGTVGSIGDARADLDTGLLGGSCCSSVTLGRGGTGEVRPESGKACPEDILLVLRHSFLMLLTLIRDEDDLGAGTAAVAFEASSEVAESSEKRLDGA